MFQNEVNLTLSINSLRVDNFKRKQTALNPSMMVLTCNNYRTISMYFTQIQDFQKKTKRTHYTCVAVTLSMHFSNNSAMSTPCNIHSPEKQTAIHSIIAALTRGKLFLVVIFF